MSFVSPIPPALRDLIAVWGCVFSLLVWPWQLHGHAADVVLSLGFWSLALLPFVVLEYVRAKRPRR